MEKDKNNFNEVVDLILSNYDEPMLSPLQRTELEKFYNSHLNLIKQLLDNGFKADFRDIDYKVWFNFVSNLVTDIEEVNTLSGEEKKGVIIELCVIVINKELKISDDLKEILVDIIRATFPSVINCLVFVSKKLHIFKPSCKTLFSCCFKKQVVEPLPSQRSIFYPSEYKN